MIESASQSKAFVDFHAFGDETQFKAIIAYGVVCVPENIRPLVESSIRELKIHFGVPPLSEFHCKVAFHFDRRIRSDWKHLTENQVLEFVDHYLNILTSRNVILSVGAVHRDEYPRELPAFGKIPSAQMDAKQLHALLFQAAMLPIIETFAPHRIKIWVDPVPDKIQWFGKRIRADRNYTALVPGGNSGNVIEPQNVGNSPPVLLEAADIVAFVAAHALCSDSARYKAQLERLYGIGSPLLRTLTYDPGLRIPKRMGRSVIEINHQRICADHRKIGFHELPIGTCSWVTGYDREGQTRECILMRVPNGETQRLKEPKRLDIRVGVRLLDGEPVACILFRFEGDGTIYTSFVHHIRNANDSPLTQLSESGEFRMVLYEDQPNHMAELIQKTQAAFWKEFASQCVGILDSSTLTPVAQRPEELWNSM